MIENLGAIELTFDESNYVYRDQATGRELSADEVDALGYDSSLRDVPADVPNYFEPTERIV